MLEIFNSKQIKLLVLDSNTWNHLTECKQMRSGLFKKFYQQTFHLHIIYIVDIYL